MMYRILIADDEKYVRESLENNIRNTFSEFEIVGGAGDGLEAMRQMIEYRADILITDIYMPKCNGLELIRRAKEEGLVMKVVVVSGYEEFSYAKEAISLGVKDYLLKPFSPQELADVLHKIINELNNQQMLRLNMSQLQEQINVHEKMEKERLLKDLLLGRLSLWTNEQMTRLNFHPETDYYCAGMFRMQYPIQREGVWKLESHEHIDHFLSLVEEDYFDGIRCQGVCMSERQTAFIWYGYARQPEQFMLKIRKGLAKLHESMIKYYGIQLFASLGSVCSSVNQIARSFQDALVLWRSVGYESQDILVFGERQKPQKEFLRTEYEDVPGQIRTLKKRLTIQMKLGHQEEAKTALRNLLRYFASLSCIKTDYIGISVEELIINVTNDMEMRGVLTDRVSHFSRSSFLRSRVEMGSLMDLKSILEEFVEQCCLAETEKGESTKAIQTVDKVKTLILNQLDVETLSLEQVSGQVHFSPNYVRQIFKQETGEGFMEYLIRKRMERAGKLLSETDLLIQDIANECGYSNQRYFASSFKKYYGCTPTDFKRNIGTNP